MHEAVHETEFVDHSWRNDKRIKVTLSHGSAHAIYRKNEGKPRIDNLPNIICLIGVKVDCSGVMTRPVHLRSYRHTRRFDHFQGIDYVHIVSPGFRKIFPGMSG